MKKTIAALGLVALLGTSSCRPFHLRIFGNGDSVESHPKEKTQNSQKNKYGEMYVKGKVIETWGTKENKQIWIQSVQDPNELFHLERLNIGSYNLMVQGDSAEVYATKVKKCNHLKQPWMKGKKITDLLLISTFYKPEQYKKSKNSEID